jgi:serpin B
VAADFYTRLAEDEGNLVMSPASISLAFGMVYAGARGNTAKEMAAAFRYDLPQEEIHAAFGTVLRGLDLGEKSKVELAVANRLFGDETVDFKSGFLGVTGDHYRAELETLDFRHAADPARVHINEWIADQTKERIADLIPPKAITKDTSLVLANAIYFKGDWKRAFDGKQTKTEDFTTPSKTVKAKMMHMTARHRFARVGKAKMLEMGYQDDGLAMQLVLPEDDDGLGAIEKELTNGLLDELTNALQTHEVVVSMPRFTIDPDEPIKLSDVLREMGMKDAFDRGKANLTAMAKLKPNENLFVREAYHKAFIEVQEEGTEAAAATAVIVNSWVTSVRPPPPPPKVFEADHPFLFVIRDLKSNAILFIGRVDDPTA